MQYILTQQEYEDLTKVKALRLQEDNKKLQRLCTKIANEMPVPRSWDASDKTPWGCILAADDVHYCDNCPIQELCPHPYKRWSR